MIGAPSVRTACRATVRSAVLLPAILRNGSVFRDAMARQSYAAKCRKTGLPTPRRKIIQKLPNRCCLTPAERGHMWTPVTRQLATQHLKDLCNPSCSWPCRLAKLGPLASAKSFAQPWEQGRLRILRPGPCGGHHLGGSCPALNFTAIHKQGISLWFTPEQRNGWPDLDDSS